MCRLLKVWWSLHDCKPCQTFDDVTPLWQRPSSFLQQRNRALFLSDAPATGLYLALMVAQMKRQAVKDVEKESQYWPRDVCLGFLQQRLCPRATITMREPRYTHTHKHARPVTHSHRETRAKQTRVGVDGDRCMLALRVLWEFKQWHGSIWGVATKEWAARGQTERRVEEEKRVHSSVGVPARRKAADQGGSGPAAIHRCCLCFAEFLNRGCKTGLAVEGKDFCLPTQNKTRQVFFFFACNMNDRLEVNLYGAKTLPWPLRWRPRWRRLHCRRFPQCFRLC